MSIFLAGRYIDYAYGRCVDNSFGWRCDVYRSRTIVLKNGRVEYD